MTLKVPLVVPDTGAIESQLPPPVVATEPDHPDVAVTVTVCAEGEVGPKVALKVNEVGATLTAAALTVNITAAVAGWPVAGVMVIVPVYAVAEAVSFDGSAVTEICPLPLPDVGVIESQFTLPVTATEPDHPDAVAT